MAYWWLKHFHIVCVGLTLVSFSPRAFWLWTMNPLLDARWVRILPHFIDTCLFASAFGNGFHCLDGKPGWVQKFRPDRIHWAGSSSAASLNACATAVFIAGRLPGLAYIVAVAVTKQPTLGLSPWA